MIPARFDYIAAKTMDEAIGLLAKHKTTPRYWRAGTLDPRHEAAPDDASDADRHRSNTRPRRHKRGRWTDSHRRDDYSLPGWNLRPAARILPAAAGKRSQMGDMQVRNKGTIGGSPAHSDPAADWPAAILALGADMVAISARGERVINATISLLILLTTALQPGEILREIRIPAARGSLRQPT